MEVTQHNFFEVLPVVNTAIEACDFVAIDLEMTGLFPSEETAYKIHNLDDHQERYEKLCCSAKSFLPSQVGLCCFRWDESTCSYVASTFNFYVFPRPIGRNSDSRFVCQTGSLSFLAGTGFDFNKFIRDGISYCDETDEKYLRERVEKASRPAAFPGSGQTNSPDITLINPPDIEFVDRCEGLVREWIDDSDQPKLLLPPCNPYLRRLLYQELSKRFPGQLSLSTEGNGRQSGIAVHRAMSEEQRQELAEQAKRSAEQALREAIGFRHVIDAIVSNKKPVVGHNMFLDMLHIHHRWLGPLPDSAQEFKANILSAFGCVLDTKQFGNDDMFTKTVNTTVLGELYARVKQPPFENPPISCAPTFPPYDDASDSFHEAAFDAYCTGVCFIRLAHYIQDKRKQSLAKIVPSSELVREVANKIFMMRSTIAFSLDSPNEAPDRSQAFKVFGFNESVQTGHILDWFKPFGRVIVKWLDDTSAIVMVQDKSKIEEIRNTLKDNDTYSIRWLPDDDKMEEDEPKEPLALPTVTGKRKRSNNSTQRKKQRVEKDSGPLSFMCPFM